MAASGDLIYIDGNQAAIVIGEGFGEDGQPDGSVIVGLFAGARQIEQGHFGSAPSIAGEHPPSYVPAGQQAVEPTAGQQAPVVASAGDQATPEATTAATEQSATQTAAGDTGVLDVGPVLPGSTDVEITAREAEDQSQIDALEARLAELRGQVAARPGLTAAEPGSGVPPADTTATGPTQATEGAPAPETTGVEGGQGSSGPTTPPGS